ncbi:MAG: ammonia-forming cytochrome c nitrite reductase [Proteobacteria bacterium]|nr:ammonia-forming cytochrome c nitrite reductase [Pseudomonadota bacterium]MBU1649923.1 ammonia-forming cytochrome c nitrite reductase [Pseudomonadota bacterium]
MNKYTLLLAGSSVAVASMLLLGNSINGKTEERKQINTSPVVKEKGVESRNEEWAKYYPREYDSWKRTKESDKIDDQLKQNPQLAVLWAGYGFSKDYNKPRGHFYTIQDITNTLRTGAPIDAVTGPMPTACWSCKSPDVPRMIEKVGELEYFTGKWAKYGQEIVNPIGCADCHDSKTGNLMITRPYLKKGLEASGVKLENITFQDMRTLVCAQCHAEYYFKKTEWTDATGTKKVAGVVTFPWANGLTAEGMEKYYDDANFSDWTHPMSKTPMLKAQHPGYEMFKTGIHAQRGVACADCHMPYVQEGAVKYSDHHITSPLDNIATTCLNCHQETEEEFKAVVKRKLERKEQLVKITMDNLAKAHLEAKKAWESGATEEEMKDIQQDIRHGQWKWDYSIASHGAFYHAPEETLRLLSVANEQAQTARLKLVSVLAKHGVVDYIAPDFSTKESAQALAGVDMVKLVAEKEQFKATLLQEWNKQAVANGILNMETRKGMSENTSYK